MAARSRYTNIDPNSISTPDITEDPQGNFQVACPHCNNRRPLDRELAEVTVRFHIDDGNFYTRGHGVTIGTHFERKFPSCNKKFWIPVRNLKRAVVGAMVRAGAITAAREEEEARQAREREARRRRWRAVLRWPFGGRGRRNTD